MDIKFNEELIDEGKAERIGCSECTKQNVAAYLRYEYGIENPNILIDDQRAFDLFKEATRFGSFAYFVGDKLYKLIA